MSVLAENKGKIGLAVALLVAAGAIYWYAAPGEPRLSSALLYVDVSTGKLYELPRGPVRVPPVANPETGEATLLPCYRDEDGQVRVSSRVRGLVKKMGEVNKVVDPETLVVRSSP